MIKLSNGHCLEFVAASGSLAFDGRGWPWEWLLRWIGILDPRLFTIVIKTIFPAPWKGNFRKSRPFDVLKFVSQEGEAINPLVAILRPQLIGGIVNSLGMTNSGFDSWLVRDYLTICRHGYKVIVSITEPDGIIGGCIRILETLKRFNAFNNIVGIEYNSSCPNIDLTLLENASMVVENCRAIKRATRLPVLLKLGFTQPYVRIAKELEGVVEAISINSVPWKIVFPDKKSPLAKYGGGGVSGKIIQPFVWQMVSELARETKIPVIGPSIWGYEDIQRLRTLGASVYHFGTIFLPYPWKPNQYVKRWMKEVKHE